MASPLERILTRGLLQQMAGGRSFDRGTAYFASGRVLTLDERGGTITATVRGTYLYRVTLRAEAGGLASGCTCPLGDDGIFCKHCVAAGLAWLAAAGRARIAGALAQHTSPAPQAVRGSRRPQPASWRRRLALLEQSTHAPDPRAPSRSAWGGREIVYAIDLPSTIAGGELVLEIGGRRRKADGAWQTVGPPAIPRGDIARLPDPSDRRILALLAGAVDSAGYASGDLWGAYSTVRPRYIVPGPLQDTLIPLLCRTGRLFLRTAPPEDAAPGRQAGAPAAVLWDDGPPWELTLEVGRDRGDGAYAVTGALRRAEERIELPAPAMLLESGFVFHDGRCGRLEHFGAFAWIAHLRREGPITVPPEHGDDLLASLMRLPRLPRLVLPEELRYEETAGPPAPRLVVRAPRHAWPGAYLEAELSFDYGGITVGAGDPARGAFLARERRFILRDPGAEERAAARLRELGFRPSSDSAAPHAPGGPMLTLAPRRLPRVVRQLVGEGWRVEAEGRIYRPAGDVRIEVASGIDWFDVRGTVEFGDLTAPLPAVLAAMRRGESIVRLGDGTYGVLPEEWLAKYGLLAGLGTPEDGRLRFARSQVGVLDALLASQPQATWDEAFARAREELRRFDAVAPADPPPAFAGELRGYQREGLGWLQFLQRLGWGGCLADDMGLGKTVQVLALLASRRGHATRPSLVVVPRSLVFNWRQEAARFTPHLRVLDHARTGRAAPGEHFREYDVVITTYGTLRRDIGDLAGVEFDYVVLDEAQAIKNAGTSTAKAARLLRGAHRLVLSGTPVENHLGELWSLFEFLNPGMLGASPALRLAGVEGRAPSPETRALLARALRPFILRRTKGQVIRDLPPKHEQTLYCDLAPSQRSVYDELREHYRRSLLRRIEREGLDRAKLQVLEALLRLRQAACHVGLLDRSRRDEPSAKLEVLLPRLTEVVEGRHKALVFSQFTSLLAIVRDRLDRSGVPYEYMDGRTRDRAARVRRFEEDAGCGLFLVSLKAGGLGLNLTAADYVFLLDPWWNPAAEAQAIDRAHRIGQTRPVFAYRLIARDTVEEKVLALQETKRELADAIITADNSLVRTLRREDLEVLLS